MFAIWLPTVFVNLYVRRGGVENGEMWGVNPGFFIQAKLELSIAREIERFKCTGRMHKDAINRTDVIEFQIRGRTCDSVAINDI